MKLPFGKHKGEELSDVPRGYLRWLHQKASLRGRLLWEVEERLGLSHTGESSEFDFADAHRRVVQMFENMDW